MEGIVHRMLAWHSAHDGVVCAALCIIRNCGGDAMQSSMIMKVANMYAWTRKCMVAEQISMCGHTSVAGTGA